MKKGTNKYGKLKKGKRKRKTLREEEKVIKLKNMCNEEVSKKIK